MLRRFYPRERAASAYTIPYEKYYDAGFRGIVFDIDNTLVPHGAPATAQAIALMAKLREMGFSLCLISNNQEPRVAPFARAVGAYAIWDAHKPQKSAYLRAVSKMEKTPEVTLFVGDQLLTDVYGANRGGLYGVVVAPVGKKEEIQIVLKRYLEKIIFYFYEREKRHAGDQRQG